MMGGMFARVLCVRLCCALAAVLACGCGGSDSRTSLTFSGSALGPEADVVRRQLARFAGQHPGVEVDLRVTPDAADQRHQLYVQWLNAHAPKPDVLQLDVIWTAEFAAAGWILPLDAFAPDARRFRRRRRRSGALARHALRDAVVRRRRPALLAHRSARPPPESLARAPRRRASAAGRGPTRFGLVWQGARYEGLVTVFLEHLDCVRRRHPRRGGRVIVDEPAAIRALTFMRDALGADGFVPSSALTWQEEQTRFAFQNGEAAFMRNWPYAWTLLQDGAQSRVAGRFAVAPFPAGDGRTPGRRARRRPARRQRAGARHPGLAEALVRFLTAPEQMIERARVAAQLPARRSLYDDPALAAALPIPLDRVRAALDAAVARPVTPVYTELSEILQVRLHRALSGQATPGGALHDAAAEMRALLARSGLADEGATP